MRISLIVPVYNRPQEVKELLESCLEQESLPHDIILVEDGSEEDARAVVSAYEDRLPLKYFYKSNSGPGLSRNYGAERASGDYFVFLDSDVILPPDYLKVVKRDLEQYRPGAFGGPDRAHPDFSPIQKAINQAMTSFFTTGGIRGGKTRMEKFHPRSFNMGISREVFEITKGFSSLRFGEDIDLSIRIDRAGFKMRLFPEAYVYHKRRSTFRQFFKQIFNSGIARINLYKRHPGTLKAVHFFPAVFLLGFLLALVLGLSGYPQLLGLYAFYLGAIVVEAGLQNFSLKVALLSGLAGFIQLSAYGSGFLLSFYRRIILGKPEFARFTRNFYK